MDRIQWLFLGFIKIGFILAVQKKYPSKEIVIELYKNRDRGLLLLVRMEFIIQPIIVLIKMGSALEQVLYQGSRAILMSVGKGMFKTHFQTPEIISEVDFWGK